MRSLKHVLAVGAVVASSVAAAPAPAQASEFKNPCIRDDGHVDLRECRETIKRLREVLAPPRSVLVDQASCLVYETLTQEPCPTA